MRRVGVGRWSIVILSLAFYSSPGNAISLDKEGDIKFGLRTYTNARVGTQTTDTTITHAPGSNLITSQSLTFPSSGEGHVRQLRSFIEAELDHDLSRLVKEGWGPLALLNYLPFKLKSLKYHLTYRGQYDMVYNWGPNEYSSSSQYFGLPENPIAVTGGAAPPCLYPFVESGGFCHRGVDVYGARHHLRRQETAQPRWEGGPVSDILFQAYVEANAGPLFLRLGRQLLVWGETDGFRLLDNINPLDNSFGGFLIPLDERRVPLWMLLGNYYLGDFGPVTDSYLEMYGAIDDSVGWFPGIPPGSPWALPNLGAPSATVIYTSATPTRTFSDMRGGGQFKWNMFDATFSIAHYYTYFDTPTTEFSVPKGFPLSTFPDGYSAHVLQGAPRVQVSGGTTTFAVPSLYSVVRSEFAYFKGEPRFRQSEIDPFVFTREPGKPLNDGERTGDSLNYVIGFDVNQWIRALNASQTFFFSTQFFYKHLLGAAPSGSIPIPGGAPVQEGEVLPVPAKLIQARGFTTFDAAEPVYVRQPTDQFLQTLLISTSYRSGTINPAFTLFYDWTGSFLYQPAIGFSRDPFRFSINYTLITAQALKGSSGLSLYRDRDNIEFRLEYVI
jgi:hypothetical protein